MRFVAVLLFVTAVAAWDSTMSGPAGPSGGVAPSAAASATPAINAPIATQTLVVPTAARGTSQVATIGPWAIYGAAARLVIVNTSISGHSNASATFIDFTSSITSVQSINATSVLVVAGSTLSVYSGSVTGPAPTPSWTWTVAGACFDIVSYNGTSRLQSPTLVNGTSWLLIGTKNLTSNASSTVYSIDLMGGAVKWSTSIPQPMTFYPVEAGFMGGANVVLARASDVTGNTYIYAMNAITGELWPNHYAYTNEDNTGYGSINTWNPSFTTGGNLLCVVTRRGFSTVNLSIPSSSSAIPNQRTYRFDQSNNGYPSMVASYNDVVYITSGSSVMYFALSNPIFSADWSSPSAMNYTRDGGADVGYNVHDAVLVNGTMTILAGTRNGIYAVDLKASSYAMWFAPARATTFFAGFGWAGSDVLTATWGDIQGLAQAYGFNLTSGKTLWRYSDNFEPFSPVVTVSLQDGVMVFAAVSANNLVVCNAQLGYVGWSYQFVDQSSVVPCSAYDPASNLAVIVDTNHDFIAMNLDGSVNASFSTSTGFLRTGNIAFTPTHACAVTRNQESVVCLNIAAGTFVTIEAVIGPVRRVVANGTYLVMSNDGGDAAFVATATLPTTPNATASATVIMRMIYENTNPTVVFTATGAFKVACSAAANMVSCFTKLGDNATSMFPSLAGTNSDTFSSNTAIHGDYVYVAGMSGLTPALFRINWATGSGIVFLNRNDSFFPSSYEVTTVSADGNYIFTLGSVFTVWTKAGTVVYSIVPPDGYLFIPSLLHSNFDESRGIMTVALQSTETFTFAAWGIYNLYNGMLLNFITFRQKSINRNPISPMTIQNGYAVFQTPTQVCVAQIAADPSGTVAALPQNGLSVPRQCWAIDGSTFTSGAAMTKDGTIIMSQAGFVMSAPVANTVYQLPTFRSPGTYVLQNTSSNPSSATLDANQKTIIIATVVVGGAVLLLAVTIVIIKKATGSSTSETTSLTQTDLNEAGYSGDHPHENADSLMEADTRN